MPRGILIGPLPNATLNPQPIYPQTVYPQPIYLQTIDLQTLNPQAIDPQVIDPQPTQMKTYSKELANLAKLYTDKSKYSGKNNNFNFKLTIFTDRC